VGPAMMRPEMRFPQWPPVMYPDDKGPTSKDQRFMLEIDSLYYSSIRAEPLSAAGSSRAERSRPIHQLRGLGVIRCH
jgi:hypothetical protein